MRSAHRLLPALACALLARQALAADWRDGVLTLDNGVARVSADPDNGGRLVEYSAGGANSLYTDPLHPEWICPDNDVNVGPCAGRFDIGPEESLPDHPALWTGAWTAERVGALHLRLSSVVDAGTGVSLTRDIVLDPGSTRLRCTQAIRNASTRPLRRSFWSRTLAVGKGLFVTEVTPDSRFPRGYISNSSWPGFQITIFPSDPAVAVVDGLLTTHGLFKQPKLGMDTSCGWMAYLLPSGQLFVKRYPVYRDRRYADVAGLTMSVFSLQDRAVELEAIGPEETLAPGESAAFTEEWFLLPYGHAADGAPGEAARIRDFVRAHAPLAER